MRFTTDYKLTPSQEDARRRIIRSYSQGFYNVGWQIYGLSNERRVRLMIHYDIPNMAGGMIKLHDACTIGVRGMVTDWFFNREEKGE